MFVYLCLFRLRIFSTYRLLIYSCKKNSICVGCIAVPFLASSALLCLQLSFRKLVIAPILNHCSPTTSVMLERSQLTTRQIISRSIIFYFPKRNFDTVVNINMTGNQKSCRAHQAGHLFRSTSKSQSNNIRGEKCPSVRTSVRPSTKSFFDLNEIWYVGRGR